MSVSKEPGAIWVCYCTALSSIPLVMENLWPKFFFMKNTVMVKNWFELVTVTTFTCMYFWFLKMLFFFVLLQCVLDHQKGSGYHYNQTEREIHHVSVVKVKLMYSLFVLKFVSVTFYDRIKLNKTLTHHTKGVSFYRTLF